MSDKQAFDWIESFVDREDQSPGALEVWRASRNFALEAVCEMLQEFATEQGTMGRAFAVCDCHDRVRKMLEEK